MTKTDSIATDINASLRHAECRGKLSRVLALALAAFQLLLVSPAHAQTGNGREKIDHVVTLTLRHVGFDSREVTIKPGLLFLRVRNRTFLPDLSVRIEREEGSQRLPLKASQLEREKPNWRERVVLTPGVYIVSVDGHPRWQTRIIVAGGAGN
jgi:hypothetical protein